MATRTLLYMPLADLRPDPRNAKGHDIATLRASMGRFGYTQPIMVDERTGQMVAGHGRRELLLDDSAAGREPPEGVEVADDGTWTVPVIRGWSSADDDEALAYLIADNRIPEAGGWRLDDLSGQLEYLAQAAGGLAGVGYTADQLDDMLAGLGAGELLAQATDAAHAAHPDRADPAVPREVQGLREVGLMFQGDDHREYLEHLAKLKRVWSEDAAPLVVLRAMRLAANGA